MFFHDCKGVQKWAQPLPVVPREWEAVAHHLLLAAQKTGTHLRVNILVSCPSFRLLKKEKLIQVPVAIIVHGKSEERDAYQDFVMQFAGEYA